MPDHPIRRSLLAALCRPLAMDGRSVDRARSLVADLVAGRPVDSHRLRLDCDRATGHQGDSPRGTRIVEQLALCGSQGSAAVIRDGEYGPVLYARTGSLAILPIHGPITMGSDPMGWLFGGQSVGEIATAVDAVLDDDEVATVLLDIDCPGGSCSVTTDLGSALGRLKDARRVVAFAHPFACSLAYYAMTFAHEMVADPDGEVGSIGTAILRYDDSERHRKAGTTVHLTTTGTLKAVGMGGSVVPDEQIELDRHQIGQNYDRFAAHISARRGISREQIDALQGAVLTAKDALAANLIDRIASFDELVAELSSTSPHAGSTTPKPASTAPRTTAASNTQRRRTAARSRTAAGRTAMAEHDPATNPPADPPTDPPVDPPVDPPTEKTIEEVQAALDEALAKIAELMTQLEALKETPAETPDEEPAKPEAMAVAFGAKVAKANCYDWMARKLTLAQCRAEHTASLAADNTRLIKERDAANARVAALSSGEQPVSTKATADPETYEGKVNAVQREKKISRAEAVAIVNAEHPRLRREYATGVGAA